mmetsp:Transcript_21264/g.61895  ORF Transcript_21264/g.61895 Transcript_21264/m.61895 type:complete len:83 (-) Transcript_21264:93-341(-)
MPRDAIMTLRHTLLGCTTANTRYQLIVERGAMVQPDLKHSPWRWTIDHTLRQRRRIVHQEAEIPRKARTHDGPDQPFMSAGT